MVKDPLADFLIRLKNAEAVKQESTLIPYNAVVWEAAKVLEKWGYLTKIDRRGKRSRRMIEASLSYDEAGKGKLSGGRRISKQSRRVYKKASELRPIKHGYGIEVISTSKGLMTGGEARKAHLGGEVLFEVW